MGSNRPPSPDTNDPLPLAMRNVLLTCPFTVCGRENAYTDPDSGEVFSEWIERQFRAARLWQCPECLGAVPMYTVADTSPPAVASRWVASRINAKRIKPPRTTGT